MKLNVDLAVVGSGFAGSLLSMIGRRLGLSVALLERGRHPRFAIGESSTPLANLLLEELARDYDLPRVASFSKWGTWQKTHPGVGCGLKRGFSFFHHRAGEPWQRHPDHRNELLVAASPNKTVADTHWYRPDFDEALVGEARALGVEYVDEALLTDARFVAGGAELAGRRGGEDLAVRARMVVDATGPRGFLHRTLRLTEKGFAGFPVTQALFTHFEQVTPWESLFPSGPENPPYPVDDAALHHVFEGGWIWVLRFNNGRVSAGAALREERAQALGWGTVDGAAAWGRLLAEHPSLGRQFAEARPVLPFVHHPRLPFRSGQVTGGGTWALLPSAAGFVDPLLSTGFPLTLLGVQRLARILEQARPGRELPGEELEGYAARTLSELDQTAELVAALYANLDDFEVFTSLSLLYFAAAIYCETLRRAGRASEADGFLLPGQPLFSAGLRRCTALARTAMTSEDRARLRREIAVVIEPLNLAGLGDPACRNWYPAKP